MEGGLKQREEEQGGRDPPEWSAQCCQGRRGSLLGGRRYRSLRETTFLLLTPSMITHCCGEGGESAVVLWPFEVTKMQWQLDSSVSNFNPDTVVSVSLCWEHGIM